MDLGLKYEIDREELSIYLIETSDTGWESVVGTIRMPMEELARALAPHLGQPLRDAAMRERNVEREKDLADARRRFFRKR